MPAVVHPPGPLKQMEEAGPRDKADTTETLSHWSCKHRDKLQQSWQDSLAHLPSHPTCVTIFLIALCELAAPFYIFTEFPLEMYNPAIWFAGVFC